MRLLNLIKGELRIVMKNGIVFVYTIFTLLYMLIIYLVPESAKIPAAQIAMLDPAAMGIFFMGAMILFEKSQRVQSSIAISPVKVGEYIIAKVVCLLIVALVMSFILGVFAGIGNILLTILGIILTSTLFSIFGLIIACKIKSLNSFIIATVPVEIMMFLPAILYMFDGINSPLWLLTPGVAGISMIIGETKYLWLTLISIITWIIIFFFICKKVVKRSFVMMEEIKL